MAVILRTRAVKNKRPERDSSSRYANLTQATGYRVVGPVDLARGRRPLAPNQGLCRAPGSHLHLKYIARLQSRTISPRDFESLIVDCVQPLSSASGTFSESRYTLTSPQLGGALERATVQDTAICVAIVRSASARD